MIRKMSAGIWAVVMLLSGLGMLGIFSIPVVAPPNMHYFGGSITIDAMNAPVGTEVFAEIDGTLYGQDSIFGGTGGYDGSAYGFWQCGHPEPDGCDPESAEHGDPESGRTSERFGLGRALQS
jgi:hypothetical protein